MYRPARFDENDPERLHRIVREYPFATLVTGMTANHLPMLLRANGKIVGHMARANPQWKQMAEGQEVMMIFQGPHAYVSPSFYVEPENVPTWNYVAVHAYGAARLIHEPGELKELLEELIGVFEGQLPRPWKLDASEAFLAPRLAAIVGFEVTVARWEGKLKLNQNRLPQDRAAAAQALAERPDEMSREVARWMNEMGVLG